jgi:serine protease Do
MMKRKEFILGAAVGLTFAAAATAGGVIQWPSAHAEPARAVGQLIPSAGAAGLAFAPPQGAPLSFADIFQQVAPAVVQIDVKTRVPRPAGRTITIPGFGQVPVPGAPGGDSGQDDEDGSTTARGAGSGFLISADGFIVTNNHVVENAEEIKVKLSDGRELTARLVGRDEATDLAVIKVSGSDMPFVSFEETATPRVGDWVIAVGNPFGLGGTATAGIVSASARDIDSNTPYTDYLQIDAAINRGNSGGPTFDIYGRVIGVNSAIYSPTGGSVGIGFAIPASVAKPITDRLMRGESIERGYLGVQIGDLDPYRESMGLPDSTRGALIVEVTPDGPAARSGLKSGDIVVGLNGRPVATSSDLTRRVGQASAGDTLRVEVLRNDRRQTLNVRSGTRPSAAELQAGTDTASPEADAPAAAARGQVVAGLTLAPMSPALRQQYDIPAEVDGVVVTGVAAGGDRRFQPGLVIMQAGRTTVTSVADVQAAVAAARAADRNTVFLMVRTPSGNSPVAMELPKAD